MSEHEENRQLEPADKNDTKSVQGPNRENTRTVIRIAAALYLLYIAYQLVSGLASGEADTPTARIVSIGGAVFFTVAAAVLLVINVRRMIQSFKESTQAMARAGEEEAQRRLDQAVEDDEDDIDDVYSVYDRPDEDDE